MLKTTTSLATLFLLLLSVLVGVAPARAQVLKGTFAAGDGYSLSIHADGTLWATGSNQYGQLGTGNTTPRSTWTQVGTATNWVQVATGLSHSLGLRADGTLWGWGANGSGQLGNTTNVGGGTPNATPVQVLSNCLQVAAGGLHTLVLKTDGTVWAFGYNQYGQLGNATNINTITSNPTPTQVPGTYVQVKAGYYHSLALRADGSLWSWGINSAGQLGYPTHINTDIPNPTPTQAAGTYVQVSAGYDHSLGLRADGTLWAWGFNKYGQLGNPSTVSSTTTSSVPVQVPGIYTQMSATMQASLGLQADGSLWAWGLNEEGQLGVSTNSGTLAVNATPLRVAGTYAQVATGYEHGLALRADGTLWTWGTNQFGQLGNSTHLGTAIPNPAPTATGTALPTRSTTANFITSYAIRGDGALLSWGSNQYGALGDGGTANRAQPALVGADHDWVQVVAGSSHALALKADGSVWAWGDNRANQVSPGTAASVGVPTRVSSLTAVSVAAGYGFNLALQADGTLVAWGANSHQQLGAGSAAASLPTPTAVSGGLRFSSMAAGGEFALGLTATGQAYGWGYDIFGQTGTPVSSAANYEVAAPTLVAGLPALKQLTAGYVFSLGLDAAGVAYGWGINERGQLGTATNSGTSAANATPRAIAGLPALRQVAGYSSHTLALTGVGTIYSWGNNDLGMLAQGTFTANASPVPTQEATLATGWAQLGTGSSGYASLVRTASGQHFASAGSNAYGQLGDGTTTDWPRFDRMLPLTSLQALPVVAMVAAAATLGLAPNPAHGRVQVLGLPVGTRLVVYDALGRPVATAAAPVLELAGLAAGVYVVRATPPGAAPLAARLLVE